MNYKFEIIKKTFTDEDGNAHEYPAYVLTIGGNEFNLNARQEDKKLLKYILNDNGFFDEE